MVRKYLENVLKHNRVVRKAVDVLRHAEAFQQGRNVICLCHQLVHKVFVAHNREVILRCEFLIAK